MYHILFIIFAFSLSCNEDEIKAVKVQDSTKAHRPVDSTPKTNISYPIKIQDQSPLKVTPSKATVQKKHRKNLQNDWIKLDKQLKSRGVAKQDKQNLVEAFVRTHGSIPQLNPHIHTLSKWTKSMTDFEKLVAHDILRLERKLQQSDKINPEIK